MAAATAQVRRGRREEILAVARRALRRRRLPRDLDRGDRDRGRHLAALPVPALPHQAGALPGLQRAPLREGARAPSAAPPPPAPRRREARGDGQGVHRELLRRPPRDPACSDAGVRRAGRPGDPRARARAATATWSAEVKRDVAAPGRTRSGASSPPACCSTSSRARPRRDATSPVLAWHGPALATSDALARARRPPSSPCSPALFVLFAGAFGGPVVGLLDSDDDFDDHGSETVLARDARRAGDRAARPRRTWWCSCGSARRRQRAGARRRSVASPQRWATRASPTGRVRDGEPRELVSRDGRSTYLLAAFRDRRRRRRRWPSGCRSGVEREPGVTAGGGELAFDAGRRAGASRTSRAPRCSPSRCSSCSRSWSSAASSPRCCRCWSAARRSSPTFVALRLVNEVEPLSVFAINLITGAGLGLAIDYSLFIVSRFREELATGAERGEALRADDADGRPHGAVQRGDGGGRDGRRCSSSPCGSCTRWASAACWSR